MAKSLIERYFDKTLDLPPGSKVYVPCSSRRDQESKRVQFYEQRRKYRRIDPDIDILIGITMEVRDTKEYIVLVKKSKDDIGFMLSPEGKMEELELSEKAAVTATDITRSIRLMVGDGLVDSEIADLLEDSYNMEEILETIKLVREE